MSHHNGGDEVLAFLLGIALTLLLLAMATTAGVVSV